MKKVFIFLTIICLMSAAYSCRRDPAKNNPFFSEWTTDFGVPPFDKIKAEHYRPAFDSAMVVHLAEIDAIVADEAEPGFDNVIAALDNSGKMLNTVLSVFSVVTASDTTPELQKIEEEISPVLAAHTDAIMLNKGLFEKVKAVYDKRAALGLDHYQMRLVERKHKEFIRAGAALSDEDMSRLKAVNEELSVVGVQFTNNLLADTKNFVLDIDSSQVSGLPQGVKDAAAQLARDRGQKGRFLFTLNKPSLIPFITYSDRRELREKIYTAYLNRGNNDDETDNKQNINDIIRLRTERAALLGYPTHAAYVLDDNIAGTAANVYALLDELWTPALESAKKDMEEMRAIKLSETGDDTFASWDWWYYANKLRVSRYDFDEETVRPYLSLENVRDGIFDLCNRLYGLTFRPVVLPVYNKECVTYEVLDADNTHLGVLYMDFFPREGKGPGAWCEILRPQRMIDGERIAPVVTISCNFTRPATKDAKALLDIDETETFFHEFGHAIHFLVSNVPFVGLLEVERDFVELPSQIMENWAFEPEMLRRYARHYRTDEVIPDRIIGKIAQSKLFNQGFATTEYLAASYSDMDIHNMTTFVPFDVNKFEVNALNTKRGLIEQIAPRYRYPYFGHIFRSGLGYSAGYYSYIWAEVLDQDAFAKFVESGDIFNKSIATAFRKEVLERGGSDDGMTLYVNFRGQQPSRMPLLIKRGLVEPPVVEKDTQEVLPLLTPEEIEAVQTGAE